MGKLISPKKTSGFTLIELMIYLSMITVVILVFNAFIVDVVRSSARAVAANSVGQDSRFMLARIGQEIKTADLVIEPVAATTQQLGLKKGTDNIYISYDAVNKAINYQINGNAPEKLSGDTIMVNDLSFYSADGKLIEITLEMENTKAGDSITKPYKLHATFYAQPRKELY
jgi:type II secretory pathway pseudopilin PulG